MSQQNKTTLQQNINTILADNSVGAISAADVRSNMINITDSLVFNNEDQAITGSVTISGDITGSIFSGSFIGDGSNLTNITTEWDGSHNGDGNITGSLTISGTSNDIIIEDGTLNFGTQEGVAQTTLPSGNAIVVAGAVYVDSAQQVGIGTVDINNKLEVDGSANIRSGLKVTGSTILNDTTGSSFTGSFVGDGSGLTNLPVANAFPYTGTAEITGSLTISGSGNTNIFGGLNVFGATPADESCITSYTSGRILTEWNDFSFGPAVTSVDAGNITITSDFTDYITLRNNGTVNALSRESGIRFTRLAFETGTITNDSVVTVPKDVTGTLALELKGYTVATLPTGTVGDRAYVTDALTPAFLVLVTGGGAVTTPVFHNGTNWVCG